MQVRLNEEELKVLEKIMDDEALREKVFSCRECCHYVGHYIKERNTITEYSELDFGHCMKRLGKKFCRANQKTCIDFELKK